MKALRLLVLAPVAALVAASLPLLTASSALAAADPVWETGNPDKVGTLAFYDASGNVITGGSVNSRPFVKYVVASQVNTVDVKATMNFAVPDPTKPITEWAVVQSTGSTTFPVATGPAAITAITNRPIATGGTGDSNLSDFLGGVALSGAAGYANTVQLRLNTSRPGSFSTTYATADILISGSTWTQVYPAPATTQPTTTTVAAVPGGSASPGANVTFTATVAPTGVAGAVQFFDGATSLGAGTYTQATGKATFATSALALGGHTIKAVFTPTDATANSGSEGTLSYSIATSTTVALTATPTSPSTYGTDVTLTSTVPVGQAGNVTFKDGTTAIGSALAVDAGTGLASKVLKPSVGTHSFTATFVQTSPTPGTTVSSALSYVVNKAATTVAVTPSAPTVVYGAPRDVSVTVSSAGGVPDGTVTVMDGTVNLGTGTLVGGTVTVPLRTTLSVRAHTFVVNYSGSASFATSTGSASMTVDKGATVVALTASPATVVYGAARSLVVKVTAPAGGTPTGTVTVMDGTVNLGTGTLSAGTVTIPLKTTLYVRIHTFDVLYGGNSGYEASTGTVTMTVNKATPTIKLAWVKNPIKSSEYGQLKVSVTRSGITPTGTVQIVIQGVAVGTRALKDGTVTITLIKKFKASSAPYAVTVNYLGSSSVNAKSAATTLKVTS